MRPNGPNDKNLLEDDPEWEALRRRLANEPEPKIGPVPQNPPPAPVDPNQQVLPPENAKVSLNITVPKFKLPKITPKHRRVGLTVLAISLIVVTGSRLSAVLIKQRSESTGVLSQSTEGALLPDGEKDTVNSQALSYNTAQKIVSFTDSIGNVELSISQQPLPESFKQNPDSEVEKLAQKLNANDVINTSNPTAFVATAPDGAQTVVFHKKGLLIFITTTGTLDKSQLAEYITRLM